MFGSHLIIKDIYFDWWEGIRVFKKEDYGEKH